MGINISEKEARQIALTCQGLHNPSHSTLDAIQQLSYVQIDTISVTERSHNHVLFSRNPTYNQNELIQLMDNKSIFEYWSHAAAYLPIQDYRFSLYNKEKYKNGGKHWFPRDIKVEKYVMDRLKQEGPLQSKDFESHKNINTEWYEWKPAKMALTNLFMEGSVMIANRKGFQKIFDLTERVLPKDVNTTEPSTNEYYKYLIDAAIRANGLVTLDEMAYLRKAIKTSLKKVVLGLQDDEQIRSIQVNGNENTYYATNKTLDILNNHPIIDDEVHILNPFDNILIQRKRVKELFNFDYTIECYVPAKKRVFGYYTLPVLYGDRFVMRIDAKADRKTGVFIVNGFWYEKGFKPTRLFHSVFNKKLKAFALFCGCNTVNKQF